MQSIHKLSLVLAFLGASKVEAQKLEFKMISSGPNRPGIAIWNSPMLEILAGLHAGMTPAQLAAITATSEAAIRAKVDSLRVEGIVRDTNGTSHPTCMVVSADEGIALTTNAASIAHEALPLMRKSVASVRTAYRDVRGLQDHAFDDVSFFLVSDVLLDNWQIGAVERRWLNAQRPLRGKARYYCAIFARSSDDREAFGIFGNQVTGVTNNRLLGVYGNRRGSGEDLSSLPKEKLARLASSPDSTSRALLIGRVIDRLERLAHTPSSFKASTLESDLEAIGLMRNGRPAFAVLDTADYRKLNDIAGAFTDDLVSFLTDATPRIRGAWQNSAWSNEVTFEEYRIWWYHFFYTALTEQLAEEGAIDIPPGGLFHYIVVNSR